MTEFGDLALLAAIAFGIAGAIKGIAGLGLPTAALGIMTLSIDPRTAIALIIIPMIATNAWQMIAAGHIARNFRRYWVFALILVLGVAVTSFLTFSTGDRFLLGALGGVILLFAWFSWFGWIPKIAAQYDRLAQAGFGAFGGLIGGLTSTWAVPIAMYLTARNTDKDEFIRATGFLIFLGSLPLALTYLGQGVLTGSLAGLSVLMLAPAFLGMWLGSLLRSRLSGQGFRKAILILFVVLAVNLLRRAFF